MSKGSNHPSDPVGLPELATAIWEAKRVIALTSVACLAAALIYGLLSPKIFRSEALLQAREATQPRGLGGVLGELSGVAELAGVSLGGGGDRAVALATLQSRTVIEAFIREKQLLPKLFAAQWDGRAAEWRSSTPPTIWESYNSFTEGVLTVSEDKATGLVTVGIEWRDAAEARDWLTEIVARTNAYLKARAIEEGERNLAYLREQSRSIGQVELQQALYGLVESELKKLMLAKGGEEFALKTIDAAVIPTQHLRPQRTLIAIFGFLGGALAGIIWALLRKSWLISAKTG